MFSQRGKEIAALEPICNIPIARSMMNSDGNYVGPDWFMLVCSGIHSTTIMIRIIQRHSEELVFGLGTINLFGMCVNYRSVSRRIEFDVDIANAYMMTHNVMTEQLPVPTPTLTQSGSVQESSVCVSQRG